jgi:hypothetical protein
MITRLGRPGEIGFDTLMPITDEMIPALKSEGFSFAIRTLETLSVEEVARLTTAGLGVAWYGAARVKDWSAATGSEDGARCAKRARDILGLPPETSGSCDMEGEVPGEAEAVAYANGWYNAALLEGMAVEAPILYRGAGSGFIEPATLFHRIAFRRYWRSMSEVPNVAVRGDCMIQLFPPNRRIGGAIIDIDVVQSDYMEGAPSFAVAES